jgi:hypothetical protein
LLLRLTLLSVGSALASKAAAGENEARVVLETVLHDMLVALSAPEWPAAELFVRLFARALVRCCRTFVGARASRTMRLWPGADGPGGGPQGQRGQQHHHAW